MKENPQIQIPPVKVESPNSSRTGENLIDIWHCHSIYFRHIINIIKLENVVHSWQTGWEKSKAWTEINTRMT